MKSRFTVKARSRFAEGKIQIEVPGVGDGKVEQQKGILEIEKRTRVEYTRDCIPGVTEPSFASAGYCIVSLSTVTGHAKATKLAVLVLTSLLTILSKTLRMFNLTDLSLLGIDDSSASIGKRYS